jgi:hypothetical protein
MFTTKELNNASLPSEQVKFKRATDTHTRERIGSRTNLSEEATRDIAAAMNGLLANTFAHKSLCG